MPDVRAAVRTGLVSAGLTLALAGVGILYTAGNDFPLGLHTDEAKKVSFIVTGEQDFHHPILMLQAARLVRAAAGLPDQAVAVAGRTTSALYILLGCLFTGLLGRRFLPDRWALGAALTLAVTPLMVIHAHYLKEDAVFLATATFALWALVRVVEAPSTGRWRVLGLALGLALAAQYKAVFLLALAWGLPWIVPRSRLPAAYERRLGGATLLAGVVFLVVCYPLVTQATTFGGGVGHEVTHVLSGHFVKIFAIPEAFTFHLRRSLLPGLGAPLLALALGGAVLVAGRWRAAGPAARVVWAFGLLLYLVTELSPSKPAPGYMRYMVPVAPAAVLAAFVLLHALRARGLRWAPLLAAVVFAVSLAESVRLVTHLEPDTRIQAQALLEILAAEPDIRPLVGQYAVPRGRDFRHYELPDPDSIRARGYTHVALSSFAYTRYLDGAGRAYQPPLVYEMARRYRTLLAYPAITFRPAYRSFAFSNPVVHIVDLRAVAGPP